MLTQGKRIANILIIHPISSSWILFDGNDITGGVDTHGGPELIAYNDRQNEICNAMLSIHRDFDYGDESIIFHHGKIEGNRFVVGNAAYQIVILPELLSIRPRTLDLLKEFISNGGKVVSIGAPPEMVNGVPSDEPAKILANAYQIVLPSWPSDFQKANRFNQPRTWIGSRVALKEGLNKITSPLLEVLDEKGQEVEYIWCHQRDLGEDRQLIFLVNFSREKTVNALVRIKTKTTGGIIEYWDAASGETRSLHSYQNGKYIATNLSFEPMQSYLLVLDTATFRSTPRSPMIETLNTIELSGPWHVEISDPNALTIDWCRWAVGERPLSKSQPTIKVRRQLISHLQENLQEHPNLTLEYLFQIDSHVKIKQKSIMLVMETPRSFSITVNGQKVSSKDVGWWRDIAFRKIPIGDYVQNGTNTLTLVGKLTPHTEIESVYIIGDFGVRSLSPFWTGDRHTVFTEGPFAICERPTEVQEDNSTGKTDITSQGYWFYAGNVTLTQLIDLPEYWFNKKDKKQIWLEIDPPDATLIHLIINKKNVAAKAWRPYKFNITEFVQAGQNQVSLRLFGSCRNLLGPHHHWRGKVLYTGPAFNFIKSTDEDEPDVPQNTWVDRYCFIQFGLMGKPKIRCVRVKDNL